VTSPGKSQPPKGSLEVIEEAIHLLRAIPLSAFATYYLGTLPFVLAALYFWADMSRSPFADQHLAGAALGLAILFLWMKFWQAVFGRELSAALVGGSGPPLTLKRCARILSAQSVLHPTGLFLMPLALVSVVGFPWLYAFYQNVTVSGMGDSEKLGDFATRCMKSARLWSGQNHVLLVALFGFGLIVWLNWATVCFALPGLIKMLLGMESVFTRSGFSLVNTTFFAVMFGLTYLSVDPILKAVYALRCFYGESLKSGQDLRAELNQVRKLVERGAVAMVVFLVLILGSPGPAFGQSDTQRTVVQTSPSVSPTELDRAITQVVQQRKYTWRMPRERVIEPESKEEGFFDRLLKRIGKFLRQVLKNVLDWMDRWLRKLFARQRHSIPAGSGYGWILAEELLLYGLLAAAVIGLGMLIFRTWKTQQSSAVALASEPIESAPDLSDQNVGAEQLPENGWTRLARELLARGEFRLALRAFYFASLANLAERNLIQLAKFKSNRDYERELLRRGHAFPDLLSLFSENVSVFDRMWYGMQEVSGELVDRFAANVEKLRSAH
jgi:hypothetical protein